MPWVIRELAAIVVLRADDRSATSAGRRWRKQQSRRGRSGYSPGHEPPRRVMIAPRLAFFLARRRVAATKDNARRLLIDVPLTTWRHFREFLAEEEVTVPEFLFATGYLIKATLYPLAALLLSLGFLLGALTGMGAIERPW